MPGHQDSDHEVSLEALLDDNLQLALAAVEELSAEQRRFLRWRMAELDYKEGVRGGTYVPR